MIRSSFKLPAQSPNEKRERRSVSGSGFVLNYDEDVNKIVLVTAAHNVQLTHKETRLPSENMRIRKIGYTDVNIKLDPNTLKIHDDWEKQKTEKEGQYSDIAIFVLNRETVKDKFQGGFSLPLNDEIPSVLKTMDLKLVGYGREDSVHTAVSHFKHKMNRCQRELYTVLTFQ